jgi:hypothetical protein
VALVFEQFLERAVTWKHPPQAVRLSAAHGRSGRRLWSRSGFSGFGAGSAK